MDPFKSLLPEASVSDWLFEICAQSEQMPHGIVLRLRGTSVALLNSRPLWVYDHI